MKLFIDPSNARVSAVGDFFRLPNIERDKIWLEVTMFTQERSRWCWAAIAEALARYYHQRPLTQRQVVSALLERPNIEPAADFEYDLDGANQNFKLDNALKYVACFGHWSPGKPLFERVQFEINEGRPVATRIEWPHGDAHYVLITGYTPNAQQILISDPLHGSAQLPFKEFPRLYKGYRGTWTETFWTNKN